jgi:hypothetical protein
VNEKERRYSKWMQGKRLNKQNSLRPVEGSSGTSQV